MKLLRLAVSAAVILFLLAGYLASQFAALNNQAYEYGLKADSAPVRELALLLLVVCIALAFVRDKEETS